MLSHSKKKVMALCLRVQFFLANPVYVVNLFYKYSHRSTPRLFQRLSSDIFCKTKVIFGTLQAGVCKAELIAAGGYLGLRAKVSIVQL